MLFGTSGQIKSPNERRTCQLKKSLKIKKQRKMKISSIILTFLVLISTAFGHYQQWGGSSSHNSRLLHTEDIKWQNVFEPHNQVIIRRTFQYPTQGNDERFLPRIGVVAVTHNAGCGENGWAELAWGGPNERFVGLEIESAPGECIDATIEIWS